MQCNANPGESAPSSRKQPEYGLRLLTDGPAACGSVPSFTCRCARVHSVCFLMLESAISHEPAALQFDGASVSLFCTSLLSPSLTQAWWQPAFFLRLEMWERWH